MVNAPATEAIMGALPPAKAGVGSAVNDTARELGGTLGVAIIGSLFASVYSTRLGELLTGSPVPAERSARSPRDSVGAGIEVARRAGEQAGPQAGAAVKAAVDTAFIDGLPRRFVGLGRRRAGRRDDRRALAAPPGRVGHGRDGAETPQLSEVAPVG